MTIDDLNEAVAVLEPIVTALQASVPGSVGRPGAAFRYACGDLLAAAPALIQTAALFTPLLECFESAVKTGASLAGMDALRLAVLAQSPVGQPGRYVTGVSYGYAMLASSRILAGTTFTSSGDVYAALASISTAFEIGQDWAADNHLPAVYQALIALGATVTRDLTTRAAPLPRLTTYSLPRGTTSHALAYRLYGDAGRADELLAENKVIHPAFMPASGTALQSENMSNFKPTENPVFTLTLQDPITLYKEPISEIGLREPRAGDILRVGNPVEYDPRFEPPRIGFNEAKAFAMLEVLSGIPVNILAQITTNDFASCCWGMARFFIPGLSTKPVEPPAT